MREREWERASAVVVPVCVCAAVARDICVKIKLMCASKANFRGQPRQKEAEREKESGSPAQLLLSLQCCRVAKRERECKKCPCNNKKNLPVRFMASIAWRMRCDWAKSTPYLKITHSAARSHLTCATPSTRTHTTHTRRSVQRCRPVQRQRERKRANDKRESDQQREHVRVRAQPNSAELCRALAVRFTARLVSGREFLWIQFEFSLRCVQTCSEKTENGKQKKVNSALNQKQTQSLPAVSAQLSTHTQHAHFVIVRVESSVPKCTK